MKILDSVTAEMLCLNFSTKLTSVLEVICIS